MGRMKSTNVWIYFTAVDEEKKVKCKLCYKYLMGKRSYNLKKHLKAAHKIEVRSTDRRRNLNKKFKQSDEHDDTIDFEPSPHDTNDYENSALQQFTILEGGEENHGDNFYDITTQQMNQTNDSDDQDSCSILPTNSSVIDIKEELVHDSSGLRNNTTANETVMEAGNESLDNNATTSQNATANNSTNSAKPPPLVRYVKAPLNDSLNSTKPAKQTNHIKPPLRKRKIIAPDNDPLEENTNAECSSNDNNNKDKNSPDFQEWSQKKKELLEIELLEMRNYKYKLELWQKEKELQVESSKYTREIRGSK